MQFIARILGAVALGITVTFVTVIALLVIVWLVNRGLQFIGGFLGYEVGDFFEWLRSVLPRRKKSKRKKTQPPKEVV